MFGLGFQEILLILLLALLLFGAKKLPAVGRAIGQSIREFKKAFQGEEGQPEEPSHDENGDSTKS